MSRATTKFLYDGANVVQEQNSKGAATANLLTGLGIDQVFLRTESKTARSFLTDALGSTIALADASEELWKEDPEPVSIRPQVLSFSTGHRCRFRPATAVVFDRPPLSFSTGLYT